MSKQTERHPNAVDHNNQLSVWGYEHLMKHSEKYFKLFKKIILKDWSFKNYHAVK